MGRPRKVGMKGEDIKKVQFDCLARDVERVERLAEMKGVSAADYWRALAASPPDIPVKTPEDLAMARNNAMGAVRFALYETLGKSEAGLALIAALAANIVAEMEHRKILTYEEKD